MLRGVLIAESIRAGVNLEHLQITVLTLTRWANPDPTEGQAAIWTILEFVSERDADDLAKTLSEVLEPRGWYADFQTETHKYVVFSNRVVAYPRGDASGRAEAIAYAREAGVPDEQIDWSE